MVIKSTVYKNALSRIEKERYFNYNCLTEDISIVFVLLNTDKSYIFYPFIYNNFNSNLI